jgi:hypothetical protein
MQAEAMIGLGSTWLKVACVGIFILGACSLVLSTFSKNRPKVDVNKGERALRG